MEYRNKAWSYVLHINYHFVCVCVEGGCIFLKTKMHTTGISNMGSFSNTCQKEHPRRNGNFRDSIIFRKHCVWLELPDIQDMIFATFKQHSQIYYTIIYLASLFKLWGFINMDVDT